METLQTTHEGSRNIIRSQRGHDLALVKRRTAPLVAMYAASPGLPRRPAVVEICTMDPPPARRITGMTCLVPRNTPLRVDRHEVIPLRFAGLLETLPEHNTGVIHQDIQLAIAVDSRAHRLDPIGVAGHIQMHVRRFAACGAYLGLDLFPLCIPDVAQYHLRAFACKQCRLCRALTP